MFACVTFSLNWTFKKSLVALQGAWGAFQTSVSGMKKIAFLQSEDI